METFNAIMKALIFIVMTGAAAIAMFVAACYFILGSKGEEDRFAIIMIFGDYDHLVQTIMGYSE